MSHTIKQMTMLRRDYAADMKRNLLRGMPPLVIVKADPPLTIAWRLLPNIIGPAAWFALGWLVHMLWGVR